MSRLAGLSNGRDTTYTATNNTFRVFLTDLLCAKHRLLQRYRGSLKGNGSVASQSGSRLSNNGGRGGLMLERGNNRRLSCCASPIEEVEAEHSRGEVGDSSAKCEFAADAV